MWLRGAEGHLAQLLRHGGAHLTTWTARKSGKKTARQAKRPRFHPWSYSVFPEKGLSRLPVTDTASFLRAGQTYFEFFSGQGMQMQQGVKSIHKARELT